MIDQASERKTCPGCNTTLPPFAPACFGCGHDFEGPYKKAADLYTVAVHYRWLVVTYGVLSGVSVTYRALQRGLRPHWPGGSLLLGGAFIGIAVVLLVALVLYTYRIAYRTGPRPAGIVALSMLIPCLNIVTLLWVSRRASVWCVRHGVAVGLLGPSPATISALAEHAAAAKEAFVGGRPTSGCS